MKPESWPHAPPHWTFSPGIYFVTASTYHREPFFDTPTKRDLVTHTLIETASKHTWELKAWVVLSNHYHLLAQSPADTGDSLRYWLREFHRLAAIEVNRTDDIEQRRIWMNFRESRITYQTSYLARLNYIHQNPVKHGLVQTADQYPWSSYRWFATHAPTGFVESVGRFSIDGLKTWDDF
jgi:putative transposase